MMVDVYLGRIGVPDSTLALEFDNFAEASQFCDIVKDHYREQKEILYMAIDKTREFEALDLMFCNEKGVDNDAEIDSEVFGMLLQMQAQNRY